MDYQFLKSFLEQSPLTYFHVFSYSPRPGTPAACRAGVSEKIKKERADELRKISREKNLAFKLRFLNEERPAVVIKKKGAKAEALTDNYIKVSLREASEVEVRQLAKVRIKKVLPSEVTGEVI